MPQKLKNHYLSILYILITIQVILLIIAAAAIYHADYYLSPAQIFTSPFPTEHNTYHPGDSVVVYVETCRYTDIPSITHAEFINDNIVYNLEPYSRRGGNIGCYQIWTPIATIPTDARAGSGAYFRGKSEIILSGWFNDSKRVASWETAPFEIVAP